MEDSMQAINRKRRVLVVACCLVLGLLASRADATTVDDILSRNKVVIGVTSAVPPFGSPNASGELEGYDIDVARMIAADLGVELEMVPVKSVNRIPFLATGKADIMVATFSATPERAKTVAFSIPYAAESAGGYGPQELAVGSVAETAGLSVGVTRGTTSDIWFTPVAPEGAEIVRYDDESTAVAAMLAGQVDMIITSNLLAAELNKRNPGKFAQKFLLRADTLHIGVPRQDLDLLQWVNTFVYYHLLAGAFNELSLQWIGEPLPPFMADP
jgi:polar amino acid transport system substrate-binding protein